MYGSSTNVGTPSWKVMSSRCAVAPGRGTAVSVIVGMCPPWCYAWTMQMTTTAEEFFAHTAQVGDCWEWQDHCHHFGHGRLWWGKYRRLAHRVAWELTHGPIPAGLCVLHRCDNPPCCNPEHLFLGTRADNVADMHRKRRAIPASGAANGNARLTESAVLAICARLDAGERQVDIAADYGITQ
ncbi:MAG TPA: HNH endonuclease signature motif containing protein, partial [Polyangia bacterium]|nr:HNH endonuclease signature motif containing protein [Polyangia bacterium]